MDTREEREKALRETVIRVRENSINHKLANTFDVQEMAALAKEKNELRERFIFRWRNESGQRSRNVDENLHLRTK